MRRSWETWWYDTSKQGIGALAIHITNVYAAPLFTGDPCTWYVINFLLDSTIGLLIIFVGIRVCHYLARRNKWPAINFGEYGKPQTNSPIPTFELPSFHLTFLSDAPKSWVYQTWIYIGLMALVKLFTTLIIQFEFWDFVKDLVISPFSNVQVEQAIIMLIIPFFVNILLFWVTDNFLMHHNRLTKTTISHISNGKPSSGLNGRTKVHYNHRGRRGNDDSESDALISEGEDSDVEILKREPGSSSSHDEYPSTRRNHRNRLSLNV